MEKINFGNTGLKVSRLSFGTGTNGFAKHSQQTRLGVDGLASLLRLAYEHGITFWDTADDYGSHPHVARALRDVPKDSVVVATKSMSRTKEKLRSDIERYTRELGVDALDIILLHFMTQSDWTERYSELIETLLRAKEKGQVKAVGVSCHGLGALRCAAEADWADVHLVRINRSGINMDASPEKVIPMIETMYTAGKAIYGMKVLGCGQLADQAHAAIQFVLQLGMVHAITIGITSREELIKNVKLVEDLFPQFPVK